MNNDLPSIRSIHQAIVELKANDPDTALSERALRRLVLTNEIPSVQIGRKYLINMDILRQYLYGERVNTKSDQHIIPKMNGIRPIQAIV